MTVPIRALLVAMLVVCLTIFASPHAYADDLADEADLQFSLGTEKYEAGNYREALERFLASNRLVPNKNVLFNIARTYEQLKRAPEAYRYYVQALEGETNVPARRRTEAAIARITPQVAILKVQTQPPGATLYLDRRDLGPRGNTPATLGLPAGSHKVIVELAGYKLAEAGPIEVRVGGESHVELKLVPILGTIDVDGEPGAEVRIDTEDGPIACVVPCSAPAVPGKRTVFVTKPGFAASESVVDVPPNGRVGIRARLAPRTGSLVVSADLRDALITLDGTPIGFTPAVLNVPVGAHTVRVSQTGYRTFTQQVVIDPKEQASVDAQLSLFEEVVAASRVSEAVEDAPASVTVIPYQELKAMAYPTVAEAVRGIRGLYLSDDRSYVTIGFRGFSRPGDYGNRVLVLLDGQPMNDNYIWSSYVGFDGRVDIDDIERIEVVRGPGSVLYGTSAFFGVINLITRSRQQSTHGEAALSAVENSTGRARVTGVVRLGENSGFWATASAAQSDGRDFFFPELVADARNPNAEIAANGLPADGNARGVDGFTAAMFTGRAWHKALTVQWFYNVRDKQLPTAEYSTILGDPRTRFRDTRGMIEARFEPQVTTEVQLLSRAHANLYDFDDVLAFALPDGESRDRFRGRWGGLEQRIVWTPASTVRVTVGGEVIRHFQALQSGESQTGPYVFDNAGNPGRNDPFTVAAGYALGDFTLHPRVKVSGGARFDYYSSLERQSFEALFNPRLAVILKPYDRGNVKLMGGKAFRAPSVYELYYSGQQQLRATGLAPEQITSGEVEYSHRFSPVVTAMIAGYANRVADVVELQDLPDGRVQYQNSRAPVLVLGSELEIRREWRSGWMLSGSYTLQRAEYLNDATLRRVPNSPVQLASLKGAVPLLGRWLMAMTRLSIEGPRPDRNVRTTDPHQGTTETGAVWDLVFSGEAERLGIKYAAGAYNVADRRYDTVPSGEFRQRTIVQNGRTFLASASVSF